MIDVANCLTVKYQILEIQLSMPKGLKQVSHLSTKQAEQRTRDMRGFHIYETWAPVILPTYELLSVTLCIVIACAVITHWSL